MRTLKSDELKVVSGAYRDGGGLRFFGEWRFGEPSGSNYWDGMEMWGPEGAGSDTWPEAHDTNNPNAYSSADVKGPGNFDNRMITMHACFAADDIKQAAELYALYPPNPADKGKVREYVSFVYFDPATGETKHSSPEANPEKSWDPNGHLRVDAETMLRALAKLPANAVILAVVHNHPMGDNKPSTYDRKAYEDMTNGDRLFDNKVIPNGITMHGSLLFFIQVGWELKPRVWDTRVILDGNAKGGVVTRPR